VSAVAGRHLEVLMFKVGALDEGPAFIVVTERSVAAYRVFGWHRLITEREIRYADIEDVRQDDERGRR
jgi:hypothetical protein